MERQWPGGKDAVLTKRTQPAGQTLVSSVIYIIKRESCSLLAESSVGVTSCDALSCFGLMMYYLCSL